MTKYFNVFMDSVAGKNTHPDWSEYNKRVRSLKWLVRNVKVGVADCVKMERAKLPTPFDAFMNTMVLVLFVMGFLMLFGAVPEHTPLQIIIYLITGRWQ